MSTKYIIITNDPAVNEVTEIASRSEKDAAIALAEATHAENAGMLTVSVLTEKGTEVFRLDSVMEADEPDDLPETMDEPSADGEAEDAPEAPVATTTGRTKPWTRVAEARFEAPEVEGYTLAYTRTRTKTGVYRANDKSGWLVLDTRSGEQVVVENTVQAREKTNALEAAEKVARQAAKEAAKAERTKAAEAKKA